MIVKDGSIIQPYADFSIEYRDASHRYWGVIGEDRLPWVSVTSALGIIDKPALRSWCERMGIEAALDLERSGELQGISTGDEGRAAQVVIKAAGLGAEAKRDAGAERGTAIHDALEIYCTDGTVPGLGDFPETSRGFVQGLCMWLIDADPQPIITEQIVGRSEEHTSELQSL